MKKGQPRSATVTMFPARLRLNRVVLMILPVAGASLFLYMPVIHWLLKKMSASNGALHGFSLIIIGGVGLYRLSLKKTAGLRQPTLYHPGLLIWFPASIIYLYNEAYIGFHTLSAALFIVHLYGLAGHFLYRQQWQFMFLPLLLMILVLPFEHYLDVYLGFPLRLLSAQLAASLLQVADLPMLTSESILMIDNRAAMIDLDCSGIKSLWVGLIFYLLLTWIERFKVNSAWLATGLAFGLLLVLGNIFRIVILVTLELVLEFGQAARLLHQPLGLLSFALSCLVVWMVLIRFGDKT
ncbi:MAG: archaeosortase/exosortase family protein, partial [Thermodesulfobacteriota bacterium]